jgi:histidine ammonia-lyase
MTEGTQSSVLFSPLDPLDLHTLLQIARYRARVAPIPADSPHPAAKRMIRSAAWVHSTMHEVELAAQEGREPTAYYGINTGFGDNAGRATFHHPVDAQRLSRKLLLSHAIGVGQHLSEEIVRAALVLRIWSLCAGYSGVRLIVVNTLIAMLNQDVYPAVPAQGSLGASGDLAPLAHLVLPLSAPLPDEPADLPSGTGWCYVEGQLISGAEAMAAAGIPQVVLGAKEGVALINGTAVSTGIAALALLEAKQVLAATTIGVALTAEAMLSFRDAFLPHVHRLRSTYQTEAAAAIHALLEGSTLIRGDADVDLPASDGPPQDPYSIRCAPVVIGAARRALEHVEAIVVDELSAVTDNPLIFASSDPTDSDEYLPRTAKVISGGNFHGEPIALAMDYLAIAVAELANIAERRTFLLSDSRQNRGLPPFLILDFSGLNNGLMIAQYTAASLVSENKSLAHPASVDSIPSSANREDHVSMSTIAARKALQIVENARQVVAIELLCAAQALSLRLESNADRHAGRRTTAILEKIRGLAIAEGKPFAVIRQDVPLAPYVAALAKAIREGVLTTS